MTGSAKRLKLLKQLRQKGHRYDLRRVVGMVTTVAILFVVPLTGLAQVDFWRGNHRLLFAPAPFKHALAGVILAIGAFYVLTFLVNVIGGRLFCGWGCPVGQLSRFGESVETPGLKPSRKLREAVKGALFSGLLVLSVFVWWVDGRVLVLGSPRAAALAWAIFLSVAALAYAHGRWWRWHFCMTTCPIGLYYSFVSPARWFGVHFRNEQATCVECNACDHVCPVDLEPRTLMAPTGPRPGLSLADAPGRNHCLECGDCIRACEWIIDRAGKPPVPLLMGFFEGEQSIDPTAELAAEFLEPPDSGSAAASG